MNQLKKQALANNTYNFSFSKGFVTTQEGNAAIDDAIKYLTGIKKSYPLYWSDGLYNSTKVQFANLQARKTNQGSAEFTQRIKTFETKAKSVGENVITGESWFGIGKFAVLRMVIDDGVPSRENRKNIFSTKYNMSGISSGSGLTVIDFA